MSVVPSAKVWSPALWLFLPLIVLFAILQFGVGFSGYYGQDSHAYLFYAKRILAFASGGELPGSFYWPVNYSLAGAGIAAVIRDPVFALPLVSLISFLFLAAMFRNTIITYFKADPKSATLFTIMGLCCSPVILRAAQFGMADLLSMCTAFAAWLFAFRYLETHQRRELVLAACLAGFAVGTRVACIVILLVPGLLALQAALRRKHFSLLVLGGLLFLLGLLPSVWFTDGLQILTRHTDSHKVSLWHWFQSEFPGSPDGHLRYPQINLVYAAHPFFKPDYNLLLPLLILLCGPKEFSLKIMRCAWLTALIYLLFIAALELQNPRFLVPALPFLFLPLYPSWSRLYEALAKPFLRGMFILLWVAFSLFAFWKITTPMIERDRIETAVAAELKKQPDVPVYSFAIDVAMPTFDVTQTFISLWSEPIHQFQKDGLVLFNEARFSRQLAGKLTMQNWTRLKTSRDLIEIKDFGQGWILYKIGEKHPE